MSSMFDDATRTVTAVQRTAAGRNAYGNTEYAETRIEVRDVLVAWESSDEQRERADRTVDTATIYDVGRQWPAGAVDRVEIDGSSWEIDGTPEDWPGTVGGTVIKLRRVRG